MKGRSPLGLIFFTVFINLIGFGIVIPVLPLYAQRFGASPFVIGLLVASYSLMQTIFAPVLGKLSDRIGRKPVLLISIVGTAAGFLLMGFADSLFLLFAGRIIDGITGGNVSAAQAYIADVTPPEQRSKKMGLIGAAFGLGFIFGPAIGGILSRYSLAAPFVFAAALAVVNAVLVWFFLPESRVKVAAEPERPPMTKQVKTILGTYFAVTVAFSLLTATYPLFVAGKYGMSVAQVGYIFAALGLVSAVIQGGLLGLLVRTFSDTGLAVAGALLLAAGFFLLPVAPSLKVVLAATAAIAIGHSFISAPLSALASKAVGASFQGRVLGAMQSAASFARIIGPVLGGWMLVRSDRAAYWTGGAITLISLVLASRLSDNGDRHGS
jgi:multidrug resistance protein